jgi:uroporphyrinogen-III decarboxylase
LNFIEARWQPLLEYVGGCGDSDQILTMSILPGILERLHYLMGMEKAIMALALEPEAVAEFVDFYADWEMEYASMVTERIHPEVLMRHDDWGFAQSMLISPDMRRELLMPAHKKLYGFYRDSGIKLVVRHSNSYAETLWPQMIEVGIDIWQGAMSANNIPVLIKGYGGQISFMGGIDDRAVDKEDWSTNEIGECVLRACEGYGKRFYVPGPPAGAPFSTYPGVYDVIMGAIDKAFDKGVLKT